MNINVFFKKNMIIIVLVAALLIRLVGLLDFSFLPDEALYAYIARGMSEGHIIISAYYHPLLTSLYPLSWFFSIFGASELVARMFSVIVGLIGVFVLYCLVLEMYDKKTALISALVLSVFPIHIALSKVVMIDIVTNLIFILLAYFMVKFWKTGLNKYLYVFAVVFGLGINNVMNIVLFVPILIVFVMLNRDVLKKLTFKNILISVVLVLIVASPTLISFFVFNMLGYDVPFLTYGKMATFGISVFDNFSYYFSGFVGDNSLFFGLLSLIGFFYGFRFKDKRDHFLIGWVLVIFLFFGIASGLRFTRYLFLAVPALSILIGRMVIDVWEYMKKNKIVLVYFLVGFAVIGFAHGVNHFPDEWTGWREVGLYLNANTNNGDLIYSDQGWLINFYADRYSTSYLNYDDLAKPPENLMFIVIKNSELGAERTREHALFIADNFPLHEEIGEFKIYSIPAGERSGRFVPKPLFIDVYLEILWYCDWNFSCLAIEIGARYNAGNPI